MIRLNTKIIALYQLKPDKLKLSYSIILTNKIPELKITSPFARE